MAECREKKTLVEFLRDRGVEEESLRAFEEDKIDCVALLEMDDDTLKNYLTAFGDRLSARAFCRCQTSSSQTSSTLLERIRSKLGRKKKSFGDDRPSQKRSKRNAEKMDRKLELGWLDYDFHKGENKQVRSQSGGGTRHIRKCKDERLEGLLATAKSLFFPDGKSKKGKIEDYNLTIQDFRGCNMGESIIGELYDNAKTQVLRLYLCTKKVENTPVGTCSSSQVASGKHDQPSTSSCEDENQPQGSDSESCDCFVVEFGKKSDEDTKSQLEETVPFVPDDDLPQIGLGIWEYEVQLSNPQQATGNGAPTQQENQQQATDSVSQPVNQQEGTDCGAQTRPENQQEGIDSGAQTQPENQQTIHSGAQTQPENQRQATNSDAQIHLINPDSAAGNAAQIQSENQRQSNDNGATAPLQQAAINDDLSFPKTLNIRLNRSNIQAEFIAVFKTPEIMSVPLNVSCVDEKGVDARGVSREAYSAFWTSFFNTVADGEDFRVSSLHPEYGLEEWLAIGRILSKGFSDHNIFPLQLAPAFLIAIMFGEENLSNEDLLESFLLFLGPLERDTIKQALHGDVLSEEDQDIFEDILDREGCHSIPKGENVHPTICQLAHKVIIQESMYALEGMKKVVKYALHSAFPDVHSIRKMYDSLKPTPKKVCDLLVANPQTKEEAQSLRFLQQYIRAQNQEGLGMLLRYLTASSVMAVTQIHVLFTDTTGLARRPVAHTCSPMLELPSTYTTYREFRSEWQAILSSGYLAMDIA